MVSRLLLRLPLRTTLFASSTACNIRLPSRCHTDGPTRQQSTEALVVAAAAHVEKLGAAKAFAEFRVVGKWQHDDVYLFAYSTGMTVLFK
jgi:hypothetical protein